VGHLTILKFVGKFANKKIGWLCHCICGKEIFRETETLRGQCSCGCRHNLVGSQNKRWRGFGEISGEAWLHILRAAKKRNIEFSISIQDAWNLFLQQNRKCILSGLDLSFSKTEKTMKFTTASLDRIDSSGGYTKNNIQWVHKDINKLKTDFPQDKFISLCQQVSDIKRQRLSNPEAK